MPLVWYEILRDDKDGVLIYLGEKRGFWAAYDWEFAFTTRGLYSPVRINPEELRSGISLFVKQRTADVIQLGINVRSDWWKCVSGNCPKPLEIHEGYMFDQVSVVLAQLPIREFDFYWSEIDPKIETYDRFWESVRDSRQKHGWEEVPKDIDVWSHSIKIRNKFFTVEHRALNRTAFCPTKSRARGELE